MFALGNSQSQDSQRVAVSSATANAQAMVLRYAGPRKDQELPEVVIRDALVTGIRSGLILSSIGGHQYVIGTSSSDRGS